MSYFAHSSAFIDEGAVIGEGAKIWHNVHVSSSAKIGKNCNIGQNCYIAGKIGEGCKIQNNVNIYLGVELGDWVFCGPSMTFTNDLTPRAKYPKKGDYERTIVEDGVSFGAHSTVVCRTKIGKWALIGAGTVVTKDVPAYAVFYGNPGRLKGWVTEHGDIIPFDFKEYVCKISGIKYRRIDEFVVERINN